MFIVVHCAGRVLRLIDKDPDGESKAKLATQCIPGAAYEFAPGSLPENVEEYALRFKESYLERLADTFLAQHGDEEVTRVEKPSGMHRRISLVEN